MMCVHMCVHVCIRCGSVQERTEFLREDLKHLFDDQGIDATSYDSQVRFEDPITKYASIQGYLFNIQMLRRVG